MSELPTAGLKVESAGDKAAARSKAKKPRDLPALVDVHVDRLCIWQSLSAEEGRTLSKTVPGDKSSSKLLNPSLNDKHAADVLRDFCVEVIVPL
jgi:DNA replication regulator SLD3